MQNAVISQIEQLEQIVSQLKKASSFQEKLEIIHPCPSVKEYLDAHPLFKSALTRLPIDREYVIKVLLCLGQGPHLFDDFTANSWDLLTQMLDKLIEVELFYGDLGGLAGYHLFFLKSLAKRKDQKLSKNYLHPAGIDLTQDSSEVRRSIRWGIENLATVGAIYPVGGAGDRLNLCDENDGNPLPVAELLFRGYSLFEGLMRDLHGLEYLFFKLYGIQEVTPIALMVSQEKNNEAHIRALCQREKWFGRPVESFKFFLQPLVPVIAEDGKWALSEPFKMIFKPGGHGVMWKLAEEKGIFKWFKSQDRSRAFVRQINNPVAGTDLGMISLIGMGSHFKKSFGFASCPRLPKTAEGMDVLIEAKSEKGFAYCLTNIEYTEFEAEGIADHAVGPDQPHSIFPSNTNILFIEIEAIRQALKELPFPGLLVNLKSKVSCLNEKREIHEVPAARLESTMQNIADAIVSEFPKQLSEEEQRNLLKTFITYNQRSKTLAVTKSLYKGEGTIVGTPEGALYEMMKNGKEFLERFCQMQVPEEQEVEDFLKNGPNLHFSCHPALGPLYTIMAQKIQGGKIERNSELELEIADLEIKNLHLHGSLLIKAEAILGKKDLSGVLIYGSETGKCTLHNVVVHNKGILRDSKNCYWKNQIEREEKVAITLHGNGEFIAENVTFLGSHAISVPDGHRMVAYQKGTEVHFQLDRISKPSWEWKFAFDEEDRILLHKIPPSLL